MRKNIKKLSSKKGLNILIIHAPWNDRGDEAAIRAMVDSLILNLKVEKITMMIMYKTFAQFPYKNIRTIEHPFSMSIYIPKITYILVHLNAFVMLFSFGKLSFTKAGKEFIKAVDQADVVIHAPGGPDIGDLYGESLFCDFSSLFELLISKVLKKKPVFFYAPSMGPFSGKFMNFVRKYILSKIDALIVREQISAEYLKKQLGLKAYVTGDSALQNDIPNNYIKKYNNISEILKLLKDEKMVGMTISDLSWHPIYGRNNKLAEKIKDSFIDAGQYLMGRGYMILLIPILFGELQERQDAGLIQKIFTSLTERKKEGRERVFILPLNIDAYAQQIIISKLFCTINVRYHGDVFSAKGGVPFIPISYEHKIDGFVKKVGFSDLLINAGDITTDRIINKFMYLEKNHSMFKKRLQRKIPLLKRESRKTTQIIVSKLRDQNLI